MFVTTVYLLLFDYSYYLVPTGVITFQRYVLTQERLPKWKDSKTRVCDLHLTTAQKIEDINNVLQVIKYQRVLLYMN